MFAIGNSQTALPVRRRSGGGSPAPTPTPTPVAGAARPDFAALGLTPAFLFHPDTETGTSLSGAEVTAVAGMAGSPALQRGATGPLQRTDAFGRKLWTFRGSDYLEALPASFTSTPRAFTILMVGRAHSSGQVINFFGHSKLNDGVTVDTIFGAMLSTYGTQGSPNYLRSTGLSSYSAGATALANMVIGQQMQVFGAAGRTTANGGTRYLMNGVGVNHTQPQNANLDMKGFRIGGYEKSNGTTNQFDLYCAVAFKGELTDAQVNAVMAYLTGHYAIPAVTRQLIMEGDSITYGINTTYERTGMQICGPGGFLPDDVRVLDIAVSGSQVVTFTNNLTTRRDTATAPWHGCLLPGGPANNVLYVQIGNNDFAIGAGNKSAAAVYPDFIAYLNTPTAGVLQRGFSVAYGVNIGSNIEPYLRQRLLDWRALIRGAQFDSDIGAAAGGPFAGRLTRIELPSITVSGAQPFESPPTGASAYFQDGTHPTAAGNLLMVGGGDTPQHGIGRLF